MSQPVPSDIDIAQSAPIRPIAEIAAGIGLGPQEWEPYGHYKAKIPLEVCARHNPRGRLILVSAITPTPAGEGKTTTTVGLAQAIRKLGHSVAVALREPSLGPCMGIKGGAAGGGYSQVLPMEDINLHFTGDIHAMGAAHNLLGALIDNHIYQGNSLQLDPRRILWRRVIDMNDRSLRHMVIGLGGMLEGVPRETGFDITVASEVMAILCLAQSYEDLKERIGNILVGFTYQNHPVFARDLKAQGAMAALLKDALKPNLVQTIEGVPAFIHGGPFANIAHGCNSVLATRLALGCADYAVTEAGFGFDLGAEKFLHIKCRKSGLSPACAVIVVTTRALKLHGGVPLAQVHQPDREGLLRGMENLEKHLENAAKFDLPVVVAINRFSYDVDAELQLILSWCSERGVAAAVADVWAQGGAGGTDLARQVLDLANNNQKSVRMLYALEDRPIDKIAAIAREVYGAKEVAYESRARKQLAQIQELKLGHLPICMAKTQKSFSDDPGKLGRPRDFTLTISEIQIAAGAGFLIPITGSIVRMPGLPKTPSAEAIDVTVDGKIEGLF